MKQISAFFLFLLSSFGAGAQVLDQGAGGFTIAHEVSVKASRDLVWMQLLRIGQWWHAGHTYSGDAANMSLRGQLGGCFCENLPGGGGVEHANVIAFMPPALLRLQGAFGPLQELAANGVLSIELKEVEGGSTRVVMTYRVSGYLKEGLQSWAEPVAGVLKQQIDGLAARFTEAPEAAAE